MSATLSTRRIRPPILRTAWRAWGSALAAMRAMPLAFVATAAVAVLVAAVVHRLGPATSVPEPTPGPTMAPSLQALAVATLVSVPLVFVNCMIAAPLAVAVHRFVVLGERTTMLPLRLPSRALAYAAYGTLFSLAYSLPLFTGALPIPHSKMAEMLVTIAVVVVVIRLTLLLPQVAVAAPGERLRTHWNDTRWRFWNTTTTLALAVVPVVALHLLVILALFGRIDGTTITTASDASLMEVLVAPYTAFGAAAMSWLFIAYTGPRDDPQAIILPP